MHSISLASFNWDKRNYLDLMSQTNFITFFGESNFSPRIVMVITRFGDLNYRIQLEVQEVLKCVQEGNLQKLLHYDQLALQRASHRVFFGFGLIIWLDHIS